MPSWHQQINAVWLELALIAAELLALTQSMLLTGEPDLARAGGPRRCATGCYTSPPGSPAANARCSCGWPSTGPGRSPSPKRSPGYGSSRSRPDPAGTPSRPPHQHHEDHGDTGPGAGTSPCPPPGTTRIPTRQDQLHPQEGLAEKPLLISEGTGRAGQAAGASSSSSKEGTRVRVPTQENDGNVHAWNHQQGWAALAMARHLRRTRVSKNRPVS